MTAEIGVMNNNGIALAADSAVTIENYNREKIYNSANKLFMLSKYCPVAIMVYGNATINGIPWEIAIKEFRRNFKDKKHDHLIEYAKSFFDYLKNDFINRENLDKWFDRQCREACIYVKNQVEKAVKDKLDGGGEFSLEDMQSFIQTTVSKIVSFIINNKDLTFNEQIAKMMDEKHFAKCREVIVGIFNKTPLSEEAICELSTAMLVWYNKDIFIPQSGIVIAGYGQSEMLPSLIEYNVEGIIPDIVKHKQSSVYQITEGNSLIVPFAQKDAVWTFCKGIDPELESVIGNSIDVMLQERYPQKVVEIIKDMGGTFDEQILLNKLKELGSGCFKGIVDSVENHKNKNFIQPLVNTASMLPLEEMASMAETFVNLSSIRKRFTSQSETVGGPIDVCVISKGDGFIWMKRKHYFDPNFNQHFSQNYYKD